MPGLVGEVVDPTGHRGESLGESGGGDGGLHGPVPVDEVRVEPEPVAGCVVLRLQIGPEDRFDVGVVEEVGMPGLDDRLTRGPVGLSLEVRILDRDLESELVLLELPANAPIVGQPTPVGNDPATVAATSKAFAVANRD